MGKVIYYLAAAAVSLFVSYNEMIFFLNYFGINLNLKL